MTMRNSRRSFLQTAAAGGALLSLGDLGFLGRLPRVSAAEADLDPNVVRLTPDIEPLVRLLEETPRERLLEEVGARIRLGTSYREVLAALLLAGVRNVQPRPSVGFKFHAVLVVNSAHIASLGSPDSDRWLPIFWALDYFKSSQARDIEEGDWTMAPVDESAVPPATRAREAFIAAMDNWDEPAADAAVAGLVRTAGSQELFEIFCRYGARDFRSIGHKAIYVANAWRTLQCIGWQYAEPVMRSLAYALLNHDGQNPAEHDLPPDQPWRRNESLAGSIRTDWLEGKPDATALAEMLDVLRTGSDEDACQLAVELINRGVAPQTIWDALLDGSGELLMRRPGIVALHAVTSTNALRYAFEATADDNSRRMMLLQNAAFLPLFRQAVINRGGTLEDLFVDQLEPLSPSGTQDDAIEEIFAQVGREPLDAARKTLGYLDAGGNAESLITAARRLVFLKGTDSHDYKYSSAVLEDFYHVSPKWRDRFLATSMFQLRGSGARDNRLVERTRAALVG